MKILFRLDAYSEVGFGHIIRSIAIAVHVKQDVENVDVVFFGRFDKVAVELLNSNFISYKNVEIQNEESEIEIFVKEYKPDVLFIDKLYNYSVSIIEKLKLKTRVVMFHNLCEGQYSVDDFVLPSAHTSSQIIKNVLWSKNKVNFYHGSLYIPINSNVKQIRKYRDSIELSAGVKNVVITSGGSDPKGVLIKILSWLIESKIENVNIKALIGASFVHNDKLEVLKRNLPSNIIIKDFDYKYFKDADVAISTFGVTTYELIYLGIPTLSVGHALTNAVASDRLAKKYGVIRSLGFIENLTSTEFIDEFYSLVNTKYTQSDYQKLHDFIDGEGVSRIANIILQRV